MSFDGLRMKGRLALLSILLLAFGLRLFHLDAQSLWADEGNSAFMTGRSLFQILDAAAGDIHPPLYYLALRVWSLVAGTTEFGLRFPSVVFGLLLVAALYSLGTRLFSPRVGTLASFLGALSPPLVYYSQEARMYSLVALAAVLSLYWFWRLLSGERRRPDPPQADEGGWALRRAQGGAWAGYLATTAMGLYTQYSFLVVPVVESLAFFLWRWPFDRLRTAPFGRLRAGHFGRHRGLWLRWLVAQGVLFLLFLPWLVRVWDQLRVWQSGGEALGVGETVERLFGFWAFGPAVERAGPPAWWLLVGLLGAALLSLWTFPRHRGGLVFLALYLVVPTGGLVALSASRPLSDPKQLLILAPAFVLGLGLGAASLGRAVAGGREPWGLVVAGGLTLAAAVALVGPLSALYFSPDLARDDYRRLVGLIEASAGPRDGVILNAPGQVEVFNYYYRGELSQYILPRQRPPEATTTKAELAQIAASHQNLWLVLWGDREADPQGVVQGWLNTHAYRGQSRWFGNVLLVRYRVGPLVAETIHPMGLSFASGVELVGYRLEEGPVEPGQTLGLSLVWRSRGPLPSRYKVFVHLRDPRGRIYAQHDAEPQGGSRPTTTWRPGEAVDDGHALTLAWGTSPGSYELVVGLYDPDSGQRLGLLSPRPGDDTTAALLAQVTVRKPLSFPPPQVVSLQHPLRLAFGSLELLGYDLTLRGEAAPRQTFAPGEVAQLVLYWRAQEAPARDLPLALRLVDNEGRVAWEEVGSPASYPTSTWEAGELVRDEHWIPLSLAPGRYRLVVVLGEEGARELGHLEIVSP